MVLVIRSTNKDFIVSWQGGNLGIRILFFQGKILQVWSCKIKVHIKIKVGLILEFGIVDIAILIPIRPFFDRV